MRDEQKFAKDIPLYPNHSLANDQAIITVIVIVIIIVIVTVTVIVIIIHKL